MADRGRSAVQPGGFWSGQQAPVSKETQELLKTMMKESKLTNFQRRTLEGNMRSGQGLPTSCNPTTSAKPRSPKVKPPPSKIVNPRTYSGGIRSLDSIETSGAYEKSNYKPPKPKCRTDRDKDRLGFIMAYGEDIKDPDPKKVIERANKKTPEEQDRFEELQNEIDERTKFMDEMEKIGKAGQYRTVIDTEISQLIREMEVIDRKKTKKLDDHIAKQEKKDTPIRDPKTTVEKQHGTTQISFG